MFTPNHDRHDTQNYTGYKELHEKDKAESLHPQRDFGTMLILQVATYLNFFIKAQKMEDTKTDFLLNLKSEIYRRSSV
jgi:hypothetical protein